MPYIYADHKTNEVLIYPSPEYTVTDVLPSWETTKLKVKNTSGVKWKGVINFQAILLNFISLQSFDKDTRKKCILLVNEMDELNKKINLTKVSVPIVTTFPKILNKKSLYIYNKHHGEKAEYYNNVFVETANVMQQIKYKWETLLKIFQTKSIDLNTPVLQCVHERKACSIYLYQLEVNQLTQNSVFNHLSLPEIIKIKELIDSKKFTKINLPTLGEASMEIAQDILNIKNIPASNTYALMPTKFETELEIPESFLFTQDPKHVAPYGVKAEMFLEIKNNIPVRIFKIKNKEENKEFCDKINIALDKLSLENIIKKSTTNKKDKQLSKI